MIIEQTKLKTKYNVIKLMMLVCLLGVSNMFAQTSNQCPCQDFKTFTIGGWGTQCSGGNTGCYRDANFAAAFPNGLTIQNTYNNKIYHRLLIL